MSPRLDQVRTLALLSILVPAVLSAQAPAVSMSAGLGGWRSVPAYAPGAPGLVHAGLVAAKPLRWGLSGMVSLGYAGTAFRGHDVAICYPLPEGGCRRDSVFPRGVLEVEAGVHFQPRHSPLALLAGGGLAQPVGQLPGAQGSDVPQLDAAATASWMVGADLQLWRGRRAPHLRLVRLALRQPVFDGAGMTTVTLSLPVLLLQR